MEHTVTEDDLKTILLKCIGSRYPVRLILRDHPSRTVFIQGFADQECSIILVSESQTSERFRILITDVGGVETLNPVSLARIRGRKFSVA